jgi:maleylpyruvate isomerase
MRPAEKLDACRTSHRRLLADLAPLTDTDFRMPSLLPRYLRAHLVTHITNKARAHIGLFEGAAAGETRRIHPVGYDPDEAVSAGAGRSAMQLRADLTTSLKDLEAAWDRCDDEMWGRQALMMAGPRTMVEVLAHHQRNIEVHHVDLDLGYRASDWPAEFVETELTKRLRALPGRANPPDLLAWLLDRRPAPVLVGPW